MSIKLAFTTLGCPEWDLETIVRSAVEYGYDGIDFRGYMRELDLHKMEQFTTRLGEAAARVRESGLEVPCVSSSARLTAYDERTRQEALDEIKGYVEIAHAFGASFVRVFGGFLKGRTLEEALEPTAQTLCAAAEIAKDAGMTIAVETHDDWVATVPLRCLFETAGWPEGAGPLWDVHHPYRLESEAPAFSYEQIGRETVYTHWKDSRKAGDSYELTLMGEGDLPLRELFQLVHKGGYRGWYTLEWEKWWVKYLPGPEAAFPGYVTLMRGFEEEICT